jgi:putative CocE/NonD family hydrolase
MKPALCSLMLLLSCMIQVWSAQAESPQTYSVSIERNVTARMRDGAVLKADIYRPRAEGNFPVLLQRTPYNKQVRAEFGERAAAQGFITVIQDVRGRYASEGEWYPFKHESDDGYDTIEWAAALPQSNGKVGMFGGSYVGATQMLAAITRPPHLAGICPVVTASNYHDGWTYQGGAFEQGFNESWTSGLAQDSMDRLIKSATNATGGAVTLPLTDYPLFNLSISNSNDLKKELASYFLDWLAHPDFDQYWRQWLVEGHYDAINVPALTIAAWYDIFQGGSLRNYQGLRAQASDVEARQKQRLLVTIGGHAGFGRKIGDVDFGPAAAEYDEDTVTLRWYDHLFHGATNEFASTRPVRIFVMGSNQWRDEDAWPLARAQTVRYYLRSAGKVAGHPGEGLLSPVPPSNEPAEDYVYDPLHPVATTGGPLCCDAEHLAPGPKDQRAVESRSDVLSFSTPALTNDTEVTGQISMELFARSSAVDTDFTAKLVDVWPNGFAQNLTEGIVRARYRNSPSTPELLVPGKIYKYKIDLWSTSNVFLKGHSIRLEISSSNFPRFDRNLNSGKLASTDVTAIKATNTIYHDREHASVLLLPIIPPSANAK